VSNFGQELRRRRLQCGFSLNQLSEITFYSKGHLSNVEKGAKQPGKEFARRLDQALRAGGELARLQPKSPTGQAEEKTAPPWTRQAATAQAINVPLAVGGYTFSAYATILRDLRMLGQRTRPMDVLAGGAPFVDILCAAAQQCDGDDRVTALRLASHFAEYLGWMAQENMDDNAAVWWISRAMALAGRAGDPKMAGYAHIRMAELAIYRDDAMGVLRYAEQALAGASDERTRAVAYQRIAQGHAIRNDEQLCREALQRGGETGVPGDDHDLTTGSAPVGGAAMPDAAAFVRGWCMLDLARAAEAVEALEPQFARIADEAVRVRARCGARLSLALASAGELDRACEVAEPTIAATMMADSATARSDLRSLARELRRSGNDPHVRRIQPDLARALHREPAPRQSE
jgi:transcriptional regulator with XRE-family HTH domain